MSDEQEIDELIRDIYFAGHTPASMAMAEKAVRLADALGDPDRGYRARTRLVEQAVFGGFTEKAIATYAWQLAYADKYPQNVDPWELLWQYKWIIPRLVEFPTISRQRILDAIEDYSRRSLEAGLGDNAASHLRWKIEMAMGFAREAVRLRGEWKKQGKGVLSDCPACVRNADVRWYSKLGKHAKAIDHAAPILSGRMKCAEVPHVTHAELLRSYVALGRMEEAEQCHLKGLRLIGGGGDFNAEMASHLDYLARVDPTRGLKLMRRHFVRVSEDRSPEKRLLFFLAARNLVRRFAGEVTSLRFVLPQDRFPFATRTTVKVAPFLEWLEAESAGLATQFDQRNGNDFNTRMLSSDTLV